MTENTAPDVTVDLKITVREGFGGEKSLRPLVLGLAPVVLIEFDDTGMNDDGAGVLGINLDATGFEPDELAGVLEVVAKGVRDAAAQEDTND